MAINPQKSTARCICIKISSFNRYIMFANTTSAGIIVLHTFRQHLLLLLGRVHIDLKSVMCYCNAPEN